MICISKCMETKIKNIHVDNNMFREIKKLTNYKKREQMPNVLYESENSEKST